ncbi:hypothetical protein [Vibrio cholerae]|uniref:hypothetical protein n=1 Tax=Vibrio cholerae TaxID=666 RepID=UPI001C30EBC3
MTPTEFNYWVLQLFADYNAFGYKIETWEEYLEGETRRYKANNNRYKANNNRYKANVYGGE